MGDLLEKERTFCKNKYPNETFLFTYFSVAVAVKLTNGIFKRMGRKLSNFLYSNLQRFGKASQKGRITTHNANKFIRNCISRRMLY